MAFNPKAYVNKNVNLVKKGGDLPPWWTLASLVVGVMFFFVFAWQTLNSGADNPTNPEVGQEAIVDDDTEEPTLDPGDDPTNETDTDDGFEQILATAQNDSITLPTSNNTQQSVPEQAVQNVATAFEARYDASVVPNVQMGAGEDFPLPSEEYPDVTFSDLSVSFYSENRITFVVRADADGEGPQQAAQLAQTVVLIGENWLVTNQG